MNRTKLKAVKSVISSVKMKLLSGLALAGYASATCTGSETYADSTTSCDSNMMKLSIPKCAFENARLNSPGNSYIAGPSLATQLTVDPSAENQCIATENGDFWEYTVSSNLEDCAGTREKNATHVIYKNAAQLTDGTSNSFISRVRTMLVDFECVFGIKIQLTATEKILPTITSYALTMPEDTGDFVVTMGIYTSSAFDTAASSDYAIEVPEPIYIQIALDLTTEFHVTLDKCWATATSSPTDAVAYEFITAGCGDSAELSAGTLNVIQNGVSTAAQFQIDAFMFNNGADPAEVYFHCEAIICDKDHETCAPTCSGRRRRRSAFIDNHIITSVGPIQVFPDNSPH